MNNRDYHMTTAPLQERSIFLPGGTRLTSRLFYPPGFPLKMNKLPPNASNYREAQTLYGGLQWRRNGYAAPNVNRNSDISDIHQTNGYAAPADLSPGSSLALSKTLKITIRDDNSHNSGLRDLTHTHFEGIYILSEVHGMGNTPLESHSCAYLSHPRSFSHTHTGSLFLPLFVTDATIGSIASQIQPEKDAFYDPFRKPTYLENSPRATMEVGRFSHRNCRRSPQLRKACGSHLRYFKDFRPNPANQGISIRMAGKSPQTEPFRSRKMAAFVVIPPLQKNDSRRGGMQ